MSSLPSHPASRTHEHSAGGTGLATVEALSYEAIFLAAPVPASISHLSDGRMLAVNDAWVAVTGRSRESVIGRTSVEAGIWPSEAQRQAFIAGLGTAEHRYTLYFAEGAAYSVRLHGVKIAAEPHPLLLTYSYEITGQMDVEPARDLERARERSEAALLEANRLLGQRLELHAALEKVARVGHWTNATDEQGVHW